MPWARGRPRRCPPGRCRRSAGRCWPGGAPGAATQDLGRAAPGCPRPKPHTVTLTAMPRCTSRDRLLAAGRAGAGGRQRPTRRTPWTGAEAGDELARALEASMRSPRRCASPAVSPPAAGGAEGPRTTDPPAQRGFVPAPTGRHAVRAAALGRVHGGGRGPRRRARIAGPRDVVLARRPAVAETASPSDAAGDRRGGPGGNRWLTPRAPARQMLRRMLDLVVPVHAGASSERRDRTVWPAGVGLEREASCSVTFSVG